MRLVGESDFDEWLQESIKELRGNRSMGRGKLGDMCDRWLDLCLEGEITPQQLDFALGLISQVASIKLGDRSQH